MQLYKIIKVFWLESLFPVTFKSDQTSPKFSVLCCIVLWPKKKTIFTIANRMLCHPRGVWTYNLSKLDHSNWNFQSSEVLTRLWRVNFAIENLQSWYSFLQAIPHPQRESIFLGGDGGGLATVWVLKGNNSNQ